MLFNVNIYSFYSRLQWDINMHTVTGIALLFFFKKGRGFVELYLNSSTLYTYIYNMALISSFSISKTLNLP